MNCLFSEEEMRQADEIIHKYEIEKLKDKIKYLESSAEFYKYQSETSREDIQKHKINIKIVLEMENKTVIRINLNHE